jgi:hypothetical protein
MLSPDLKVGTFCQVFGKQNVIVIDYENSANTNRLIQDFLSVLGIPDNLDFVSQSDANSQNRSMALVDTEIVRALNHIMSATYGQSGAHIRNTYQQNKSELNVDEINELETIINAHCRDLSVGNYFIDVRAEQVMSNRFADNIINHEPNSAIKKVKIASGEWTLNRRALEIIDNIAAIVVKKLPSQQ